MIERYEIDPTLEITSGMVRAVLSLSVQNDVDHALGFYWRSIQYYYRGGWVPRKELVTDYRRPTWCEIDRSVSKGEKRPRITLGDADGVIVVYRQASGGRLTRKLS